jgi:hypothetical protein
LVEGRFETPRECFRDDGGLVKTAFADALVVQRNGDDAGCCVQRFALRNAEEEINQVRSDMRLAL